MRRRHRQTMLARMWKCQVSVDIDREPEAVYARLLDFTRHSEFSGALARVEQTTAGPIAVGTRFRAQETVPAKFVSFSEITALDKPRLIAWKAWVPHAMRTRWEFRIEPRAGGTRLVQLSEWEAAGPVGWLMLNLHRKRNVARENRRTLEQIKDALESNVREQVAS
jgi:Polyketide cyclase / dehydrase and lipid transport